MHFYTLQGLSNLICRCNAVDGHYLNLVLVTFRAFCFCIINVYSQVLKIVWKKSMCTRTLYVYTYVTVD